MTRLALALALVVALAGASAPALGSPAAQSRSGTLLGRVLDEAGSPMPGALVLVGTPNLDVVFAKVTSGPRGGWSGGDFEFRGLPVGRPLWVVAVDEDGAHAGVVAFSLTGSGARRIDLPARFPLTLSGIASGLIEGWANKLFDEAIGGQGAWQQILGFTEGLERRQRSDLVRLLQQAVVAVTPEGPARPSELEPPPSRPRQPDPPEPPAPPVAPPPAPPAVKPSPGAATPAASSSIFYDSPAGPRATDPAMPPRASQLPPAAGGGALPGTAPGQETLPGSWAAAVASDAPVPRILATGRVESVMGNTLEVLILAGADAVHPGLRLQVVGADGETIAEGALTTGEGFRYVAELSETLSLESVREGCLVRVVGGSEISR